MVTKNGIRIRALAMSTLLATCSVACSAHNVDPAKKESVEQDIDVTDREKEKIFNHNDSSSWIHRVNPNKTDFTRWKDKDYEVGKHNLYMKIDEDAYYDQLIELEAPEGYTIEYYFPMEVGLRNGRGRYANVKFTNTEPVTVRGYYDTEKECYIYATFGTPKESVKVKTFSENKN